jgi:hypothetical protein
MVKHTTLYGKTPHAVQGQRKNWQVSDGFGYFCSGGVRDGLGAYPQETQKSVNHVLTHRIYIVSSPSWSRPSPSTVIVTR